LRFLVLGAASAGVLVLAVLVFAWVRGRSAASLSDVAELPQVAPVVTSLAVATRRAAALRTPAPGALSGSVAPAVPPPVTATPLPLALPTAAPVTYQVQSGDSLWSISRELGVDQGELLTLNPGSDQSLPIGSLLALPITATPDAAAPAAATAEVLVAATPLVVAPPAVYVARAGDTLANVAADHGVTLADLAAMNEQEWSGESQALAPGQLVRVRSDASTAGADAGPGKPFAAPLLLAPADGATVHDDASLLRWTSSGILPEDAYYVVQLRDLDAPETAAGETVWVASNSTTLVVPANLRPALGRGRRLAWSVTVRRSPDGRPGPGEGELLSESPEAHTFTWTP
jgi:LysM repeat protein